MEPESDEANLANEKRYEGTCLCIKLFTPMLAIFLTRVGSLPMFTPENVENCVT